MNVLWLLILGCGAPQALDRESDADTAAEADDTSPAPADADGDGWPGSTDCDDANPDVHPGATEAWCSDVDENCDGLLVRCTDDATFGLQTLDKRTACNDYAIMSGMGDIDGDGRGDLAIGCTGASLGETEWNGSDIRLILGSSLTRGDQELKDATLVQFGVIPGPHVYYDAMTTTGDLDGDGRTDVLVAGNTDTERGWAWFPGSALLAGGSLTVADGATWVPEGGAPGYMAGPVNVGDVDGDGIDEIFLTRTTNADYEEFLLPADRFAVPGTTLDDATISLGNGVGVARGRADFDGDGLADLAMDGGSAECASGCVRIFTGATLSTSTGAGDLTADALGQVGLFVSNSFKPNVTWSNDLDGDGAPELVVIGALSDGLGRDPLQVFVVGGHEIIGEFDLLESSSVQVVESPSLAIRAALPTPDLDGDGRGEISLIVEDGEGLRALALLVGAELASGGQSTVDDRSWIRYDARLDPTSDLYTLGEALGSLDGDDVPELGFGAVGGMEDHYGFFSGAEMF